MTQSPGSTRWHVLLVEDEPWFLDSLGLALRQVAWLRVSKAKSAEAALAAVASDLPDVIVTGLQVGRSGSGPGLLELLPERAPGAAIVAMGREAGAEGEALSRGASLYLEKPFRIDALCAQVATLLLRRGDRLSRADRAALEDVLARCGGPASPRASEARDEVDDDELLSALVATPLAAQAAQAMQQAPRQGEPSRVEAEPESDERPTMRPARPPSATLPEVGLHLAPSAPAGQAEVRAAPVSVRSVIEVADEHPVSSRLSRAGLLERGVVLDEDGSVLGGVGGENDDLLDAAFVASALDALVTRSVSLGPAVGALVESGPRSILVVKERGVSCCFVVPRKAAVTRALTEARAALDEVLGGRA